MADDNNHQAKLLAAALYEIRLQLVGRMAKMNDSPEPLAGALAYALHNDALAVLAPSSRQGLPAPALTLWAAASWIRQMSSLSFESPSSGMSWSAFAVSRSSSKRSSSASVSKISFAACSASRAPGSSAMAVRKTLAELSNCSRS